MNRRSAIKNLNNGWKPLNGLKDGLMPKQQ
jgi:hypothetical protein